MHLTNKNGKNNNWSSSEEEAAYKAVENTLIVKKQVWKNYWHLVKEEFDRLRGPDPMWDRSSQAIRKHVTVDDEICKALWIAKKAEVKRLGGR